jgi:hypothetical protein
MIIVQDNNGKTIPVVRVTKSSREVNTLKGVFTMAMFMVGVVVSHMIAASWVIEATFVIFIGTLAYAIFDMNKKPDDKKQPVTMSKGQLQTWLEAGCPDLD